MRDVVEITDDWGADIRVDVVTGDSDHPQFVEITIKDSPWAAATVELTREQVEALRNALTDAIG